MKNTIQTISSAIILLSIVAVPSAFANSPVPVETVVEQATGDMAKEAAGQVVDSAKEKAIALAKEQADSAVDTGINKLSESLDPTKEVGEAVQAAAE